MAFIPVGILAGIAGLGQIDKSLDEASLSLRAGSMRTIAQESITVGVRPEAITLSQQGNESQRCKVNHVAYMGAQYEVTVDWNGQTLLLQVNATQLQPKEGEDYYLEIHPIGMFILEGETQG